MNLDTIREDLCLDSGIVYLDNAAASVMPRQVLKAVTGYLERTATVGPYLPSFRRETYAKLETIRASTAAFIGATTEEIAFNKNGSEGISLVAQGIDWQEGDEVIITDFEMLSNLTPWLLLQQAGRILVRTVVSNAQGLLDLEALAALITPRTRLISITHLPNATGAVQPIAAVCKLAQERGIMTLINAAQSLGLIPIDVRELRCDFLVACGRKALRGPEGTGVLYVRAALIPTLTPALVGWWNSSFDPEQNTFALPLTGKRFEAGCPIVPSVIGLGAAIDYANQIGVDNIARRVAQLTAYTIERLLSIPGAQIYGPESIQDRMLIIPFNIDGVDADKIVQHLDAHGVIIEAGHFMATPIMNRHQINKMARISPHYFNTEAEIDSAIALIRELL
ncbi:aminotransferase class V-fold PLP-dependent enzyme [Collimonas antrihumi]|uniref:aminotransferase class V-fold PLP-dependent enzyme n=1 Tax=Collimonas antrihumi TaxID=1940615 RepID=UPI001B8D4DF8|nr:aminotransferase class V-fold PLP-dependent enzyme [Collimonas antrihumi]